MDAVITRIIEIEKQSTLDIERAENDSLKNIEEHKRFLEEEKERTQASIISTENTRLTGAIRAFNKKTEETFLAVGKGFESRLQDTVTVGAVKEKIVDILLAG
jgi:hypothetical protein